MMMMMMRRRKEGLCLFSRKCYVWTIKTENEWPVNSCHVYYLKRNNCPIIAMPILNWMAKNRYRVRPLQFLVKM